MVASTVSILSFATTWAFMAQIVSAFTGPAISSGALRSSKTASINMPSSPSFSSSVGPLLMSDDFIQETAEATKERIEALVENHPVLLFMKGSKLFPQCGFSNTAVQILNSFDIDFHAVDVLSDEAIRQGVKDFSQWPTIPQLYVCGEFIGGSDIMIEMYQTGELGEMIEKVSPVPDDI
jgi:monothiol glutaredoxin